MFFDERFSRPRSRVPPYRPQLAATVVRSGRARKSPAKPKPGGMGVYEYSTQYARDTQQQAGPGWALEQYGDQGDDSFRQRVHDQIVDGAKSILAAGWMTDEEAGNVVTAADSGALLYPTLTAALAADSLAKTAYYYMMDASGWWSLRRQVFAAINRKVNEEAVTAARTTAVWTAIAGTMAVVSGAALIDKLNDLLRRVRGEVDATNQILAQARAQLTPERYALVAKEASGVQAQLTYLEKYVPGASADVGHVGVGIAVQAIAAIAVAAALAIAALCWAYTQSKKMAVANKMAEMVEAQRKAEVDAAMKNPNLSAEQKQTAVAQAGDRAKAGAAQAAAAAAKAGEGGGLFGIDFKWLAIAGVAVAGVMLLPAVLGALPKRSATPAQA
jgi:hypothetical protein